MRDVVYRCWHKHCCIFKSFGTLLYFHQVHHLIKAIHRKSNSWTTLPILMTHACEQFYARNSPRVLSTTGVVA